MTSSLSTAEAEHVAGAVGRDVARKLDLLSLVHAVDDVGDGPDVLSGQIRGERAGLERSEADQPVLHSLADRLQAAGVVATVDANLLEQHVGLEVEVLHVLA